MKVLHLRETIDKLGATAIFVAHDEPERVRASLLDGLEVPYPVAVDLERNAYRAWGCRRASFARIWLDPRVWVRYLREAARNRRAARLGVDTLQLGGDFVVDRDGRIAYARPQVRDDRPPVRVLVNVLETL